LSSVQLLLAVGTFYKRLANEWARLRARFLRWGSPAFFALPVFAGLLMFHHSFLMEHNHDSPKLLFNHMVLGVLALVSAGTKLLWEMRWMTWRRGGLLWPATVLAVGVLLVFYTKQNIKRPPLMR
jgi:hypothetical protein